jgi:predicted DNA-binding protein YlxM (UPF0122 family)
MKKRKKRKPDKLKEGGILQFSLEGKFIREYSSVREATKVLKIGYSAVHYCLTGHQKTGGNFQWRYKIDPNFDEGILDIPPIITTLLYNLQSVVQYTLEGKFVKEYASIKEAAEIFAVSPILIAQCIRGGKKSTKGYQWRLKKDVSKDGKIMDIEPVKRKPALAVCKFDRDGKFIREYPSMFEAARDEHVSRGAIYLRIKRKKCEDYQWRFKAEVVKDGKIIDIGTLKKTGSKKSFMTKYSYPVCQFSKNGIFIREYPSTLEAAKETDLPRHIVFSCAVKKIKGPGGFHWRFKEEVVDKNGKIIDIGKSKKSSPFYFRAVCQFELDGKFIREFPSINKAAKPMNMSKYSILSCAFKIIESSGGFQWRFKDEVVNKDGKIGNIKPTGPVLPHFHLAVYQFGLDGTFIRQYPSIIEAAKKTNISRYTIFSCADKKIKSAGGFKWQFKKEVVKEKNDRKEMTSKCIKRDFSHYFLSVCQFEQDGTFVREYPSIYEASEKTNITRNLIFTNASRKAKNRDGYLWRLKEDVVDKDGKILDIDTSKPIPERFLRPVCQFERDGKFIREYPTILDAAQKTSIHKEYIHICARRKIKITGGYQWRHKDDPQFKNGITDIAPYEIKISRRRKKKKV